MITKITKTASPKTKDEALGCTFLSRFLELVVTLICNGGDMCINTYYYNRFSFPPNYLARYILVFLFRAQLKINGSLTRCKRFINQLKVLTQAFAEPSELEGRRGLYGHMQPPPPLKILLAVGEKSFPFKRSCISVCQPDFQNFRRLCKEQISVVIKDPTVSDDVSRQLIYLYAHTHQMRSRCQGF